MNTLIKLLDYGQSYWLDNLTREKIQSGELRKRVEEQGLRGITSNPSTFNKAISKSTDYDEQIRRLVDKKLPVREIYEALTVEDVRDACDVLRPVYDESGEDGFVSLEVSPYLAHDTKGTIEEARRLFKRVDRPNCFIKIPGTEAGFPAIEEMLYEGININITLLFSIQSYEAVAYAYLKALERRVADDKPINKITSVASFFLSRIDVLADQLLSHHIVPGGKGDSPAPELLMGKVANANAKLAYQSFKKIFSGDRWQKLAGKGARVQRPLWASTSTKNPLYHDVRYVEPLIGKNTVNTLPDKTIEAFSDHGILRENTVEEGLEEARRVFEDLEKTTVSLDFITRQLTNEGIEKFIQPYDALLASLAKKRQKMLGDRSPEQEITYGPSESEVKEALAALDEKQFSRRLYARDPGLWPHQGDAEAEAIKNRLGWLDGTARFLDQVPALKTWADEIKTEGFRRIILLGMGGSSLCSEVTRQFLGSREGYPELSILDNTHPGAIRALTSQIDLQKSLFIVASKSGTTTETLGFYQYFYQLVQQGSNAPGSHFIAITDAGTPLAREASEKRFRRIFENPEDYGGRYSVLSYFGLVPMALAGADIQGIMENARQMEISCGPGIPSAANPAALLGLFLGINQRQWRDKVTLVLPDSISSFGLWLEQLLAESTGKQGKGLIPIAGEALGAPEDYRKDRVFIHIYAKGEKDGETVKKLQLLKEAGHPVARIRIGDKAAIGSEFVRWEFATAVAGAVMGINPFDEPNVAESKKNTANLLAKYKNERSFGNSEALLKEKGISAYAGENASWMPEGPPRSINELLISFIHAAQPGDYIALLAYFQPNRQRHENLQALRTDLRNKLQCATSLDYGPRYLHSTGQLHKGGPNNGIFLMFTAGMEEEITIPGENYDFNHLHQAKFLGDLQALENKKRKIVRIHFEQGIEKGLEKMREIITSI